MSKKNEKRAIPQSWFFIASGIAVIISLVLGFSAGKSYKEKESANKPGTGNE